MTDIIRAFLIRHGVLREPRRSIEDCGWRMIALHMAEATPRRRLS